MVSSTVSQLLKKLNCLLIDGLTPHSVICQFENLATLLKQESLQITQVQCKEYYDDEDLSLILSMKNEAIANGQFDQAARFRFMEKELKLEKGEHELTRLKIEPCFFEFHGGSIVFHFDKRKENQRLINNLIEDYNLHHKKYITSKSNALLSAWF